MTAVESNGIREWESAENGWEPTVCLYRCIAYNSQQNYLVGMLISSRWYIVMYIIRIYQSALPNRFIIPLVSSATRLTTYARKFVTVCINTSNDLNIPLFLKDMLCTPRDLFFLVNTLKTSLFLCKLKRRHQAIIERVRRSRHGDGNTCTERKNVED